MQVEVGGVEPVVVLQGPATVARPNCVARKTISGGLQVRVVGYRAGRAGVSVVPGYKINCYFYLELVIFIDDCLTSTVALSFCANLIFLTNP